MAKPAPSKRGQRRVNLPHACADLCDENRMVEAVRIDAHPVEGVIEKRLGRVEMLFNESISSSFDANHQNNRTTCKTSRSNGERTEVFDMSRQINCTASRQTSH